MPSSSSMLLHPEEDFEYWLFLSLAAVTCESHVAKPDCDISMRQIAIELFVCYMLTPMYI